MSKIEIQNVRFCYPGQCGCYRALDDYNLTIEDGEFTCILGKSGSGKTTLLRLIAGFTKPTLGDVFIDDENGNAPGPDKAVVFQNYSLFPWLTAKKNIVFSILEANKTKIKKARATNAKISNKTIKPIIKLPKKNTKQEAEKIADYYLEMVDMTDHAYKYPKELSGGMKQRIAIAKALAMDSNILLLDEPFGALDTKNRSELQDLLLNLWGSKDKKKTVIFVTHDIDEAVKLADKIVFMEPGRVKEVITVDLPRPRKNLAPEHVEKCLNLKEHLRELYYESAPEEKKETCCG